MKATKIRTTGAGTYWWTVREVREVGGKIQTTTIRMRQGRWGSIRSTTTYKENGIVSDHKYSYLERNSGNGTWNVRPSEAMVWLGSYVKDGYEIVSVDSDLRYDVEKMLAEMAQA